MGGLYRAAALRSVGYASDRNLYAYEEQDLGLRLRARGWRLRRIPVPAILHHGHRDHTLTLMRKRWRSGYLFGPGQILRASFGRSWFGAVLWGQRHLLATLCLWALLLAGLVAAQFSLIPLAVWLAVMGLLTLQRIVRLGSLADGLLSVLVWHVNAIALLCGLFLPQVDPRLHLEAQVLSRNRL
jgi:hypothetical protein